MKKNSETRKLVRERNKILYSLDVEAYKNYLRDNGAFVPDRPDWFWRGSMAKAIMNIENAPESKRIWARGVLNQLGWSEEL